MNRQQPTKNTFEMLTGQTDLCFRFALHQYLCLGCAGASARPVWMWGTDILPDITTGLAEIIAAPPAQSARHPPSPVSSAMRSSAVYLGRYCINPIGPLKLHLVVVCFLLFCCGRPSPIITWRIVSLSCHCQMTLVVISFTCVRQSKTTRKLAKNFVCRI